MSSRKASASPRTTEEEYQKLDARVREAPGFQVQVALEHINESRKVLDGNTRELEEELEGFRGALSEFDWKKDPGGRAQISELNRRLQNYVTARMTLRDHTIRELKTLDLWEGTDWYRDKYLSKLKELLVKDSFAFLQDLRNYVSHNRIFPISAGIKGSEAGIEQHISLDADRLKQWDRWSAAAQRFLDEQGERVDISQLVAEYKAAVGEFYLWLSGSVMEVKWSDIAASKGLWQERERIRRELVAQTGKSYD